MTVHAYTSCNFGYLDRARVLASTLRKQHPDWVLWIILTDKEPLGFDFQPAENGFDRVVFADELYGQETEAWLFGHDVVEACTAVKGQALLRIMEDPTAEKVLYFDPDIAVFNPVDPVVDLLDEYSIVLTPHQTDPEAPDEVRAILDNEVTSLGLGVFNLGFIAVRNDDEGRRFASWWTERLQDWCHDRREIGLFVDQKWCDLIPCFFDRFKVLRDPGYNVASWNLSQRTVSFSDDGTVLSNGKPLRFFHFTKLGEIGDLMTQRYAADNIEVYELWRWYRDCVHSEADPRIPDGWWYYSSFDNGTKIPKPVRVLYRDRADLRAAFPSPRQASDGFFDWLRGHGYV